MTENPKPYLTLEDVAARLAVSPMTARRLVTSGKLPGLRLGRVLRVAPEDMEAFLEQRRANLRETIRRMKEGGPIEPGNRHETGAYLPPGALEGDLSLSPEQLRAAHQDWMKEQGKIQPRKGPRKAPRKKDTPEPSDGAYGK